MTISVDAWSRYLRLLRRINDQAAEEMMRYIRAHSGIWSTPGGIEDTIAFAFALSTRYGEAATALACEMYDAVAAASGVSVPLAEPAATASYGEVAKAVRGTAKTENPEIVADSVSRSVKMAGVDTTMKNALRDGAEWAWIPSGDTCAFCVTLASRGWQRASRNAIKGGHAEHIHANCDCTYAIRFDGKSSVAGYRPDEYRALYEHAAGGTPEQKINSMRRTFYAENAEKINAQKRSAYEKRRERESSAAEEMDV